MNTMRLPKGWRIGGAYRLDAAGLVRKVAAARAILRRGGDLAGYLRVCKSNGLAVDQVAAIRAALERETK